MQKQFTTLHVNEDNERKVEQLLSKMTLSEKIGQMTQCGTLKENDEEMVREGKIGSLLNVKGAKNVNTIQRIAVEESRLRISLIIVSMLNNTLLLSWVRSRFG
jgi:beta-glucosidase